MAMFSTFGAWALVQAGIPLGLALLLALAASFAGGMVIERVIIRPVEGEDPLTMLIVTLGLFILVNSAAGWIWGFNNRGFPRALPDGSAKIAGINLSDESLGIVAGLLVVVGRLSLRFQKTKLRVAARAAAANPASARLVGIDVGRTLAIGWGLAALLGALAGVLVGPQLLLDVTFMGAVLVCSFAAATLGGFDSPKGAVIGGWIIGVAETLAGEYIGFIGSDLTILVALGIIFGVLLVRPNGLFGSPEVVRA